jgi:cytochrome P450
VFQGLIDARRQQHDSYDDLITTLLQPPFKDRSFMDDPTIVSFFTGLLFARYETTAGQAAWLVT